MMARALLLAGTLVLAGCGGDDKKKEGGPPPPPPPGAAAAGDPAAGGTPGEGPREVGDFIVLGENKKWKPLQPLFEAYKQREPTALTNPMLSNVTDFVTRPLAAAKPDPEAAAATAGAAGAGGCADLRPGTPEYEATPPLEREPLGRYKLALLMTGRSDPMAMVLDPQDNQFPVRRGDRIGCEGGVVRDILQYKLFIQQPGQAKPVVWSNEPAINPVEQAASRQATEREVEPPKTRKPTK